MIENFGSNIARLRKEKNMTQKDLADKLGVNKQTISNIEKGEGYPTFKNLEKLSQILNANAIQLFGKPSEIVVSDTPLILDRIDEYHDKIRDVLQVEKVFSTFHDSQGNPNELFHNIVTLASSIKTIEKAYDLDENANLTSLLPSDEEIYIINTLATSLKYLDGVFVETKIPDERSISEGLSNGSIDELDIYEGNIPYNVYPPRISKILPTDEKIEEVHRLAKDLKYIEENK
ncbi:DNA-binding transcriptional regulator, XRE-family HTH domain [Pilibacter termitis]|uniref:DNA-binding transcriptional regulator, XRE-family HTH domain n=1 Tax=Pilibacter termitis TaxID=263852 RepID=A0A1T4NVI1_9ENTE|nr:helix-turn-helix domain-containing protein [Pilibacter termitis]SJZ83264.1 DNA-binding transcriptional regulator, XRE-family HTH domain [Pilibacter termitis]